MQYSRPSSRGTVGALLALLAVFLLASPLLAAGNSPAEPVPADRWGDPPQLRPWAIFGDTTFYDGKFVPRKESPIWHEADIAGHHLITATGKGLMIHDLAANPEEPAQLGYAYGRDAAPEWFESDLKFYIYDVDAPGNNPKVALTGGAGQGVLIWDLDNPSYPKVAYQDYQNSSGIDGVWASRIGSRDYGFAAVGGDGVQVYDLTNGAQCKRWNTADGMRCDGVSGDVYLGRIPTGGAALDVEGTGKYLAVSLGRGGVEIYDVSNPRSAKKLVAGGDIGRFQGIAMWKTGGSHYVAVVDQSKSDGEYFTHIYDVGCIATNTCATAKPFAKPIKSLSSGSYIMTSVKDSLAKGRSYLYIGSIDTGSGGDQREFAYDVTDPRNPVDLVPKNPPGKGYFGWYYEGNAGTGEGGFEGVAPRAALAWSDGAKTYLYRAGFTILDVHEILGEAPPTAAFHWTPETVYAGQPIDFVSDATGATEWAWSFDGVDPAQATSTDENPADIVFLTPNTSPGYDVTLIPSNDIGLGDALTRKVVVRDPVPSFSADPTKSPSSAFVCQEIRFSIPAGDPTGYPAPTISWEVTDAAGDTVAVGGHTETYTWTPPSGTAAGTYTATVTGTNDAGTASRSVDVVISALPALTDISGSAPTTNDFSANVVDFAAPAHEGATSWTWDFGDGTVVTITDPVEGPNPSHVYAKTSADAGFPDGYPVTVTITNCDEPTGSTSAVALVEVLQTEPLEAKFKVEKSDPDVSCPSLGVGGLKIPCEVQVDRSISFDDSSSGAELYHYDWDGDGTYEDGGHASPVTSHTFTSLGKVSPRLKVTRGGGAEEHVYQHDDLVVVAAEPAAITVSGPSTGTPGTSYTFSASTAHCAPVGSGWTWTASDGGEVSGSGSSISARWSTTGTMTVTAKNSGCTGAVGTKSIRIQVSTGGGGGGGGSGGGGGGGGSANLDARFSFSPASPKTGQAVSFDAGSSTGSPTSYSWTFGDGATASGRTASHTFGQPGTYRVTLSVSKPDPSCSSSVGGLPGTCTDSTTKSIVVTQAVSLLASFDDGDACEAAAVGGAVCQVDVGREITFTDTSEGKAESWSWDFGDGTTKQGRVVKHSWQEPGSYKVQLTVAGSSLSAKATKTYFVTGEAATPVADSNAVVLPFVADTGGVLEQSSDLYIFNPGPGPMELTLRFLKRGTPEASPPEVKRTLAAGATLFLADVLEEHFDRENLTGFLYIEPREEDPRPIVASFSHTFENGRTYGQMVPGLPISDLPAATVGSEIQVQHLIGLDDDIDRRAYLGLTNPNDEPAFYHLRFYDTDGRLLATSENGEPLPLSRFGLKQFQVFELRERFGVEATSDYRVEVETVQGGPIYTWAVNVREGSDDPSFVRAGRTGQDEVFLVGTLSTPGLNDSLWQSDVVIGNVSEEVVVTEITFTPVGFQSTPTAPEVVALQPGETLRLEDLLANEWGLTNAVGVVRVVSDSPVGVFPVVQGESYDVSRPGERYGQFMPALVGDDAAGAGERQSLVGLRQDDAHRTTLWLFNAAGETAEYTLRYRKLDGTVLGVQEGLKLGAGKMRQVNPSQHPLPEAGVAGGFTVEVEVVEGSVLTAAQVVNQFNDPAYIVGQ